MAAKNTEETVHEVIRSILGMSAMTDLTNEDTFAGLGADSLDAIEIVMELEEELEIEIQDGEYEKIETVQQMVDLCKSKVA